MKKMGNFSLIIALTCLLQHTPAFAGDPVTKLARGLANVVESPLELPAYYQRLAATDNPLIALVGGSLWGAGALVSRVVVGAYEIVTFPFPIPFNYAPILQPETPVEGFFALRGKE